MNDKDVIIERLTQRLDRLQNRIESLLEQNVQLSRRYQKQVDQLTDQIKTLSAENLELKERVSLHRLFRIFAFLKKCVIFIVEEDVSSEGRIS
jgi:predicted PurR-regulated permease PerM